ncbi:hypothetical protein GGQ85_004004 [Nitrobacter vulgaris]|nr:hypothetical protein [Nitrobacter vulgaris]
MFGSGVVAMPSPDHHGLPADERVRCGSPHGGRTYRSCQTDPRRAKNRVREDHISGRRTGLSAGCIEESRHALGKIIPLGMLFYGEPAIVQK